ncbi:septum formation initiator family protein [Alphaproteobacteria bacterium]|nr:septum formation initiator family protein [Alphaproteobacteria bacterium]
MNKSLALKKKISLFLLLIIFFFVFFYLFYFLINGDRGIISYFKVNKINQNLSTKLVKLEKSNNYLTDRVDRLKTNSLDLDFLDEKIRENTGFLDSDEILVKFN